MKIKDIDMVLWTRSGFVFMAVLGATVTGIAAGAQAAEAFGGRLSFSGSVASDYIQRGRSQNDEDIAVRGNIDYEHDSGLFAGVRAATVELSGADAEVRGYAGHTGSLGTAFYVVTAEYAGYPGATGDLGYAEFRGALGVDYGFLLLRAGAAYSPDFFADSGDGAYVFSEFDALLPFGWPVSVSLNGHIGRQSISDAAAFGADDYYDWDLGLTFSIDRFDFDLRYHDTTIRDAAFGQEADARAVAGVTVYF